MQSPQSARIGGGGFPPSTTPHTPFQITLHAQDATPHLSKTPKLNLKKLKKKLKKNQTPF
jgi:hypothetical protein